MSIFYEIEFAKYILPYLAAVAVLFAAFAVHARPADEDTDGNLEEISHLQ